MPPLTSENLVMALCGALSAAAEVRVPYEAALRGWDSWSNVAPNLDEGTTHGPPHPIRKRVARLWRWCPERIPDERETDPT